MTYIAHAYKTIKMASNFFMAGRWSVLYIAFEISFIVMKMILWGPSRSKMQFFRAKMTVIAFEVASVKEERR